MKSYEEIYETVKKELSVARLKHSEGVSERCVEFAKLNGIDINKARLIGIAHDIAKEIPREDRIKIAIEKGIDLDEFEKENTGLIRAKLGAEICKERFDFSDDMCQAIVAHTTAKQKMSILDKILYLSDYCEPSRDFKQAQEAYEIGRINLNEGYYKALVGKIKFTIDKNSKIHKDSIDAYNSYLDENKKKQEKGT